MRESIALKENKSKISLDNAWLSGFIDVSCFLDISSIVRKKSTSHVILDHQERFLSFHISCDIVTLKTNSWSFVRANNGVKNIKSRKNEVMTLLLKWVVKHFVKK